MGPPLRLWYQSTIPDLGQPLCLPKSEPFLDSHTYLTPHTHTYLHVHTYEKKKNGTPVNLNPVKRCSSSVGREGVFLTDIGIRVVSMKVGPLLEWFVDHTGLPPVPPFTRTLIYGGV